MSTTISLNLVCCIAFVSSVINYICSDLPIRRLLPSLLDQLDQIHFIPNHLPLWCVTEHDLDGCLPIVDKSHILVSILVMLSPRTVMENVFYVITSKGYSPVCLLMVLAKSLNFSTC